uniref:MBOAT_2 domain-containing protein n=1 Tax=Heterorhabditis bacteriophora TaxID=37862 RepID=A0A1I7WMQ8_HETBA
MTSSDRFVPVALGRWETRLHWIIWVSHSLAAFLIAYNVSNGPAKQWINHWMSPSSYFTGMVMDLSDSEWLFYRRTVEHLIFDYSVHSVAIFLIMRLLRNDIARYAIPPPAPICISRVSRYSRMWRHFDAGLYQFLKNQVYIPLMRPTLPPILSAARSAATLIAVFGVVLAWHGSRTHYVCWVSLSACELIIEWIGKSIWISSHFQKLRIMIGERNTRRIISLCMLFTVIPGIFGVFFFLGQDGIGSTIFNEVLLSGIHELSKGNVSIAGTNSGSVLTHLLILGYFFNNVCLDFEQDRVHH